MTSPVGRIRVDLTIDGSNAKTDLARELTQALAPASAMVHRELNQVQREYDETARDAQKSSTKQTAAAKATSKAVHELGDEHTKTAAKAQASGRASAAAISHVTREIERQTAALQALVAVDAMLKRLPAPVAEAFIQSMVHGRSAKEVAADMGVSDRTVRHYLSRAMLACLRLQSRLGLDNGDPA